MSKVAYVLGAGFAKPAGLPLQSELLLESLKVKPKTLGHRFDIAREMIENFLGVVFPNVEVKKLSLEDVFTILDRAVLGKEPFGDFDWGELYQIRQNLIYILLVFIDSKIKLALEQKYQPYDRFIEFLFKKVRDKEDFCVISLNWDSLLESFVYHKFPNKIMVNYCLESWSAKRKKKLRKAEKGIKVLKLHGSTNWILCNHCGRLFIEFEGIEFEEQECVFCEFDRPAKAALLTASPLIVTPTMIKELDNLHLKTIWHKAFIELQASTKIIFIGYSLPLADFELRYLLKKALDSKKEIEVVLKKGTSTNATRAMYEGVFGEKITFYFDGFGKWVKDHC